MPNLESLNVNGCIMLGRLAPRHCLRLRSIDAVGCAALRTLSCPSPPLRSLAVQACSELVVRPRPARLKRSKARLFRRASHVWTASLILLPSLSAFHASAGCALGRDASAGPGHGGLRQAGPPGDAAAGGAGGAAARRRRGSAKGAGREVQGH